MHPAHILCIFSTVLIFQQTNFNLSANYEHVILVADNMHLLVIQL